MAAERSESEPGLQKLLCPHRTVKGSGVPPICPQPVAVRALPNIPKIARIRAKRTNEGEAGMVRGEGKDRAPQAACRPRSGVATLSYTPCRAFPQRPRQELMQKLSDRWVVLPRSMSQAAGAG